MALRLLTAMLFSLLPLQASAMDLPEKTPLAQMQSGTYTLDDSHASLIWRVNHVGLSNYTARFTDIDATIELDPKDPTNSTLSVTIDPLSLETDYPEPEKTDFDKKLATGSEWLNAEKFPKITYVSKTIEKTGDNTAIIHGELSFLGVTKPLDMDVTFNGAYEKMPFMNNGALGFSARATLDRTLWGMTNYVPTIGKDVEIQIEAEFHKGS